MSVWLVVLGQVGNIAILVYAVGAARREVEARWRSALADVASRWGRDPLAKAVLDAVEDAGISDRERARRRQVRDDLRRDVFGR